METSSVISSEPILSPAEMKKLTDFFSLLIKIDQKQKAKQRRNDNISKYQKYETNNK
jgi:hypothetical protein